MNTASSHTDNFDFPDDDDFGPDNYSNDYGDGYTAAPRDITTAPSVQTADKRLARRMAAVIPLPTPQAPAPAAAQAAPQPTPSFNFYGNVPDPTLIPQAATMKMTDMGLGARLAIHYKDRLVFRKTALGGVWMIWTGTHWEEDPTKGGAESRTRTVIASISRDEAAWAESADPAVRAAEKALNRFMAANQPQDVIDNAQETLMRAKTAAKRARVDFGESCENGTGHIYAAVEAATAHLSVPSERFDMDLYLVNFKNGTLNLRTLELTPHSPQQYITKVAAVDWDPAAKHADLDRILATLAKSDSGLPAFLQRYLGSAMSGSSKAKSFVALKGDADAGKSTLFLAFAAALGDVNGSGYARVVSPSLFAISSRDGEAPQPTLHNLNGVRFVFADESEKGFMDRETVNVLSAGGSMTTRTTHGKPMTWKAQTKIVFAGNDYMPMPDNDPGIRRRLIACSLTHSLTEEELDVDLQDRVLTPEFQRALLAWAASGCSEWIRDGENREALKLTDTMNGTATSVLSEFDPLADFWDTYVIEGDEDGDELADYVPLTTVQWYREYAKYCFDNRLPVKIKDEKQLAKRLNDRGFPAAKTAGSYSASGPSHSRKMLNKGKFRRGIRHNGNKNATWLLNVEEPL